jgi:hypothetical protein
VITLVALCVVLTIAIANLVFHIWGGGSPRPLPPDLTSCTRIEIRYFPTVLGYPVWISEAEEKLLTPAEVQHIETLLQFVIDDPGQISAFAQTVASGSYGGVQSGVPSTKTVAAVLCHFDDRPPMRLRLYGTSRLVTADKQTFSYRAQLGLLARISSQVASSELLSQIRLRIRCARNLQYLHTGLRGFEDQAVYPSPSTWCDAVLNRYLDRGEAERNIRRQFECPTVGEGSCNYAMNPSCKSESPADTVLLFEIKEGWNQHGGPELFKVDNHEPRGGCVLLNDGIVKFIRTEDELRQLRWR